MWSCPKIRFVTYSFVSYLSRPIENFCLGPICIALTVLLRFTRFIPAPVSIRNTRSVVRVDKSIVSNLPVVMLTRMFRAVRLYSGSMLLLVFRPFPELLEFLRVVGRTGSVVANFGICWPCVPAFRI